MFLFLGKDVFAQVLPGACLTPTIPNAGHFLQEDQGPYVAKLIIQFITFGCTG